MIEIFKVGDVEYPEKLNKPIRYDSMFLKDIASKTNQITITKDHSREELGVLRNFIYEDGFLKAEKPDDFDLKGFGFSPVFECDLIDKGDYYQPVKGVMSEIGLTKSPRSHILYNSIEDVGVDVSESLDIVIKEKEELQKKIGVLESKNKSFEKLLKQKDDEIAKVNSSYDEIKEMMEDFESVKEKAELYDGMQTTLKEELINEICGDNEIYRKALEGNDVETLKALKDNPIQVREGSGIPPVIAEDFNNGEIPPNQEDDDVVTEEELLKDYAAAGWTD